MRIGTLGIGDGTALALVTDAGAVVLAEAAAAVDQVIEAQDMIALLEEWERHHPVLSAAWAAVDDLIRRDAVTVHDRARLRAPVPRPGKVIAIGRNYADHATEMGNDLPPEPMVFVKYASAVVGPFDDIVRPPFVDDLDYEAELAVVIGRRGRDIREAEALGHVAGYCCANDVSARTAQMATGQFVRGKSFDTFCPLGPVLVTADEVPDPQDLGIRCRVDGRVRQQANTAQMIFGVTRLVSHCSAATTLEPGDIILTGTPSGVAMGRTPSPWLQPGQLCEVEIDGLGRIANRVRAA